MNYEQMERHCGEEEPPAHFVVLPCTCDQQPGVHWARVGRSARQIINHLETCTDLGIGHFRDLRS